MVYVPNVPFSDPNIGNPRRSSRGTVGVKVAHENVSVQGYTASRVKIASFDLRHMLWTQDSVESHYCVIFGPEIRFVSPSGHGAFSSLVATLLA